MEKRYLGGGIYAVVHQNAQIILMTGNDKQQPLKDIIRLDPAVIEALIIYARLNKLINI